MNPGLHNVSSHRLASLTVRELEVLNLIADGHPSSSVADKLFVSKRTVDFHLASAYTKLQVKNRMQAVTVARRNGLLALEPESADTIENTDAP